MGDPMRRGELVGYFSGTWSLILLASIDHGGQVWALWLGGFFGFGAVAIWILDWYRQRLDRKLRQLEELNRARFAQAGTRSRH